MANSIQLDYQGPDWPLGFIKVVTPGTPVNIMSLVDPSNVNSPNATGLNAVGATQALRREYSPRVYQITFMAYKPGAAHGVQLNTGNIYVVRQGNAGAGNRDDYGSIVMVLTAGQVISIPPAGINLDMFSPYRYFIDADNANDGAQVTCYPQA